MGPCDRGESAFEITPADGGHYAIVLFTEPGGNAAAQTFLGKIVTGADGDEDRRELASVSGGTRNETVRLLVEALLVDQAGRARNFTEARKILAIREGR